MHIAIDARFLNSGTGTYGVRLLEYLEKLDTTNTYSIIVARKDIDYWKPTRPNFTIRPVDFPYYSFAEQIGFNRYLNALKPDLVHFAMPQQPIWYTGNHVTTLHDLILLHTYNSDKNWLMFHTKQLIGRWVFKRIAKTNTHMIAVSKNTKREYQKFCHIPDDRISVIYEAANPPSHTLQPYDLPFDEFIMYVGQQPDYKNITRLAEAHQQLLRTHPRLGLVLVGRMNDDTRAHQALFQKRGYTNIIFTGFLPDTQRDWLFTKARAYVFPSLMEGFGLPPLEAMACGTPVVSSNTSCMPEILGDAAEYMNPYSITDITKTIERVITNDALRYQMVNRGYAQVERYSWETMARETLAIYQQALRR